MFLPFYGNLDNIDEVMSYLLTVDEFIAAIRDKHAID